MFLYRLIKWKEYVQRYLIARHKTVSRAHAEARNLPVVEVWEPSDFKETRNIRYVASRSRHIESTITTGNRLSG